MKRSIETRLLTALLALPALALADPPQPTQGGGVSCNPPCSVYQCGNGSCVACNTDGCTVIKYPKEENPVS